MPRISFNCHANALEEYFDLSKQSDHRIAGDMLIKVEFSGRNVAAVVTCYCFIIAAAVIVLWLGGIVSVVCSIVSSKGSKPFMWDLTRAATWPYSGFFVNLS